MKNCCPGEEYYHEDCQQRRASLKGKDLTDLFWTAGEADCWEALRNLQEAVCQDMTGNHSDRNSLDMKRKRNIIL